MSLLGIGPRSIKTEAQRAEASDRDIAALRLDQPDSKIGIAPMQVDCLDIGDDFKRQVGILARQLRQRRDDDVVRKRLGRGEPHPSSDRSLCSRSFGKCFGRLFQRLGALQQGRAIISQAIAVLVPTEQRQAKRGFQPLDLARHGSETGAELRCRTAQRSAARDGKEYARVVPSQAASTMISDFGNQITVLGGFLH